MESDFYSDIVSIKQRFFDSINHKHFKYIKDLIDKNVKDCNFLYTQVCYLIKLFLLNDYENDHSYNDYKFDEHFIRFCFKLIRKNDLNFDDNLNNDIQNRIHKFYIQFNSNPNNLFKFSCPSDIKSIIHITDALSRDIQTNITNNITINYLKYLKEYIKINLNLDFKDFKDFNVDSKTISNVFNDIIFNTFHSNLVFHNWINKHKKLIIPNIKNNIFIASIKDGIQNHYKLFTSFINKYIKTNNILNDLIKINNDKKINQSIKSIYNDIINNTFETDAFYHDWIKENTFLIINEFNKSNCIDLEKELESNPFVFIPYMLFINKNLETNESKKKFQIIPLRTNLTPKFIPINTDSFVDILDSDYLLGNIKNYYHNDSKKGLILFDTYFNFTSKFIQNTLKKGYLFSGLILTNGFEIIFNFNSKSYDKKKNNFHTCGKIERDFIKKSTEELSEEQITKFLIDNTNKKNEDKKEKTKLLKEKNKNVKDKQKEHDKIKLNKIKSDIDKLKIGFENNLNTLSTNHFDTLNNKLNKIDITNIENKEIMKNADDKLSSDKAYLTHCFERDYNSLIYDFENNFESNFNILVCNDKENDKKINEIKNKIFIKKKELKMFNNNQFKLINENYKKEIKQHNFILNNNNKNFNIKMKKLIDKIREKIKSLSYETKNKELTLNHIKDIKIKLVDLVKKIYLVQKYQNLNDYLNKITNNKIESLQEIILKSSTKETKIIFNLCLKILILSLSLNKNENSLYPLYKVNMERIKCLKKEKCKTDNYINKHKELKEELEKYSKELNKLMKIKKNNENKMMNLFKINSNEYMQIDNMSKNLLEILSKLNWVVIDPGMNSILTMLSKDGKKSYSYSKEKHLNRTNRKRIMKKIEKIKKEKINKLENELSNDDTRLRTSNDYKQFNSYFLIKMKIHNELEKLYNDERLNKLKWMLFINEKRSENLLVNDIKKKFGEKIVLILGNWSMNKKGIKSTAVPNKKYENILKRNFITLKINEFRTSIIHNKTEKRCENLIKKYDIKKETIKSIYLLEGLKIKNKDKYEKVIKDKRIHKILVCKTNEKLNEYVNRDVNSVKNMKKIVSLYISTNYKPKTFVLGTKICNNTLCVM